MNELDFDEVLADFDFDDEVDALLEDYEEEYEEDSDGYTPDDELIECIECDEIGHITDVIDVPYSDIGAVSQAAVNAAFHLKSPFPFIRMSGPAGRAAALTDMMAKTKAAAAAKSRTMTPQKPKKPKKPKVKAKAKVKAKVKIQAGGTSSFISPVIASVMQAAKTIKTPVIKPGTKSAKVLKKLASSARIKAKLGPAQMKKVAVAISAAPISRVAASPYIAPHPVAAPSPAAPISFPIPATSPVVSAPEVSAKKVDIIRKAKKMPSERPKKSINFIPGKKHEMVCLGQSVPRRLYDLVLEHSKKKLKTRKKRALECAGAVKTTEKKLIGGSKLARQPSKTTNLPKDYIKIACGLPA